MTKCPQAEKSENNQIKDGIHPSPAGLPYERSTRIKNGEQSDLPHLHAINQNARGVYHFEEEVC